MGKLDRQISISECTDVWVDGQMDVWMDGWLGGGGHEGVVGWMMDMRMDG